MTQAAARSDEGRSHDATPEGRDGPAARVPHDRRAGSPLVVQLREAFTVSQDLAFLDECLVTCARIADAIRAGTYALDEDFDRTSTTFRSTIGEDLPLLGLTLPRRDDAEGPPFAPPAANLLPALERANVVVGPMGVHDVLLPHAMPAMLRAIDVGRVLPPHMPGWIATLRLPTPWSPAAIESRATGDDGTDLETCGPEADALPTQCRLLVKRKEAYGRPVQGKWLWTLSTRIVSFNAKRLPDAMTTLRILAEMETGKG